MRSPMPITVIIACPHCSTRYQVPSETLGSAGRKVACAHCGQSWMAEPGAAMAVSEPDDRLFSEADERELDRSFSEEEAALREIPSAVRQLIPQGEVPPPEVMRSISEIKAALESRTGTTVSTLAPPEISPSSAAQKKAQGQLERRQRAFANGLPAARFRGVLRGVGFGLLVAVIGGGVLFRTEIVRVLPDLAGLYAGLGLKVNVVGLDFADVTTLLSRRGGSDVMTVNATIYGVEARRVLVPPVVVTLLGEDGVPVYSWSVAPRQGDLEPGEVIAFSAELASPPREARQVRLSFADSTRASTPAVSTIVQPTAVTPVVQATDDNKESLD